MKEHIKMRTVAENIKKYRLKKGWAQEELAERAEVSHAFVNQIENCKRDMTLGYDAIRPGLSLINRAFADMRIQFYTTFTPTVGGHWKK